MEELQEKLRTLEKLCYEYDTICGLFYILKDSILQNEEFLTAQYSVGYIYISNIMIEFQKNLHNLLDDLFTTFRNMKKSNI